MKKESSAGQIDNAGQKKSGINDALSKKERTLRE